MTGALEQLLAAKEIVVCCGPGGVGKTTTAAAMAAQAAVRIGGRVLVVTVDPARRLADALGMPVVGNTEARVGSEVFERAGVTPRGELWAAMLDAKQSWDELVRRHAPDDATRAAIFANPLYQNISGRFVQSHDYIAMERLYDIHRSGRYDLVVVDTPPSRNALDLLDAPARMAEFFGGRLLRWLTVPYRSRLVTAASKPFYSVADRILGSQFLEDIAEFFVLFQSMYAGFVERARAVERVLADRRTTFVVVSTLEAAPVREAEYFLTEVRRRRLHLGALVLNRVLPAWLADELADLAAQRMADDPGGVAVAVAPAVGAHPAELARVVAEVAQGFHNMARAAKVEAEQRAELATRPDVTCTVPWFTEDVADLAGLLQAGAHLWNA